MSLKDEITQAIKANSGGDNLKDEIRNAIKGPDKKGPPSLLEQTRGLVSGLPAGLAGFARDVVVDFHHGQQDRARNLGGKAAPKLTKEERAKRYPFTEATKESMGRTLPRVGQGIVSLAPGGIRPSETRYGEAIRKGEILGAIIEDVGNAAIVGGVAGKALGAGAAAGSSRAAAAANFRRVALGADRAAAAPARIWAAPVTGVKLPTRIFGEGAKIPGLADAARAAHLGERITASNVGQAVNRAMIAQGWDAATREQRANLRDTYIVPAVQERQLVGRAHELAVKQAERFLRDRDAQYANHLLRSGQQQLAEQALALTGDQQAKFIRDVWGQEQAPSIKTLRLVDEYAKGRLPEQVREAMDLSWSVTERLLKAHEEARLSGEGYVTGPMSEEQLLDEPMPSAIENVTYKRRAEIERIRRDLEGDPLADDPGLRAQARAARARVPEVRAADVASERAVARLEAAGGLRGRALLAREQAERMRAGEAAAVGDVSRMTERGLPGPDSDAVPTSVVERGAVGVDRAGRRAERAAREAERARGGIFRAAGREAVKGIADDGGLFSPENRARLRPEDITPETVRPDLERMDADLRGVASSAIEDAYAEIDRLFDGRKLAHKPTQRLATKAERERRGVRHIDDVQGEWDWFSQLSPDEQARIRGKWMAREGEGGGAAPDQMHQAHTQGDVGSNVPVEETMAEFVRRTREIDALEAIAAGKGTPEDVDLVGHLIDQAAQQRGVRLDMDDVAGSMRYELEAGRAGRGPKQRMAKRAEAFAEHMRQKVTRENLPPEPPIRGSGPLAWEMPVEQFVDEALSLSEQLAAAARRLDELGDEWATYTPAEKALFARMRELVPEEFEVASLAETHRAIVEAAQAHDYPVPENLRYVRQEPQTPEQVAETAGEAAVRDSEAAALDALEYDMQAEAAFKADGRKVPKDALEYGSLTAGQKAIYREARARARKVGAEQALTEARARVTAKLEAKGERFGRRVGEAQGRARLFRTEAGRLERTAAAAERRLDDKVTESIGEVTPEERAILEPALPEGEELLGRYEREVTPGAASRARSEYERSLMKPIRAGERKGIAEQKARTLERGVRSKERRMAWLEDKLTEQEAHLATGPLLPGRNQVVPGRWRLPLINAEHARRSLAEMADDLEEITGDPVAAAELRRLEAELPRTMEDLKAAGVLPEYIIGGYEEAPRGSASVPGQRESLPFRGKASSERMKVEGTLPKSTRKVGQKLLADASRVIENKTADRIAAEVGVPGRTFIERALEGIDEADPEYAALADRLERGGHDLVMFMERENMVPWDPSSPRGTIHEKAVTADTLFLPKPLFEEFRRYFKPAKQHWALSVLDAPVRGWKHMVLAMSPSWHIGNVVGNMFLATVGGGLSPIELAKYGKETLELLRRERQTGEVFFPPRLYGAGMGGEMLRFFADREKEGRGIFGRHPIQASYALNAFVDDWGRSTVYLAKKAKGMTDEQAVAEALKAMGDFGKMTPFERDFIRRAIPFYAWTRHITKLAYHLAVEHPFRVAWTLHLANTFRGPQEEGLPEFLRGSFALGGGRYISSGLLNPLEQVAANPLSPASIARGVNPMAKVAAAGLFGVNLSKNREFTRAPGTHPLDAFGNRRFGPLDPKQFAYVLAQLTPITRAAYNAATDQVLRYDTGDPMRFGGQDIATSDTKASAIARQFVPFLPLEYDVEGAKERRAKKLEDAARSRARYFGG